FRSTREGVETFNLTATDDGGVENGGEDSVSVLGVETLNLTATDDGGVENGGEDSVSVLVNFSITLVTAPPDFSIADNLTTTEGSSYPSSAASSFSFSDDGENANASSFITLLPNALQPETLY
ncbi:hypothetical protein T484DRAFT_1818995, partial [Baffinella frigidus]